MYLSDLLRNVTLQIPNCIDEVAMQALVNGARRFYRETTLWRDIRGYSLTAGSDSIRLRVPEETFVHSVRSVVFEGRELRRVDAVDFEEYVGSEAYRPEVFLPQTRDNLVRIGPATSRDQSNAYKVECVLVPTIDADELLVDNFASEFESAYEYAALASLFSMPIFINAQLSSLNEARYADIAQQAMNKAQGLTQGGVIVTGYGGL